MAGDFPAAEAILRSLDVEGRAELKSWFEGPGRSWFREFDTWEAFDRAEDKNAHSKAARTSSWVESMCGVVLSGPVAAARRVRWSSFSYQAPAAERALVQVLKQADREWVEQFVTAASQAKLSNARYSNAQLSRILREVVVHHDLPCPTGSTFLEEWLAGTEEGPLLERLRRDPLMPDLLFHYLAAGHGGHTPELPDVVPLLIAEGLVDRGRVVDVALERLTTPQRVSSQRVTAQILVAVALSAGEIPGGLTYLYGVIATSHGSVGALLLPHALELVEDADDLRELVTIIGSRSERKQKKDLLRAMQSDHMRTRIDGSLLADLMMMLADGDDDSAFVAEVSRVAARVSGGVERPSTLPVPEALGLWTMTLQEPVSIDKPRYWDHDLLTTWTHMLSKSPERVDAHRSWTVDWTVSEMAQGGFDPDSIPRVVEEMLVGDTLLLSRVTHVLEELFLMGAMNRTWAAALAVSDHVCGAPRRLPGLAGLLRMLSTYAVDAPPGDLPPALQALAAESGKTKAHHEARVLGALMARTSVEDFQGRAESRLDPTIHTRQRRGYWNLCPPGAPRLAEIRVPASDLVDLDGLRDELAKDRASRYLYVRDLGTVGAMTRPMVLLDKIICASHGLGAEVVQRSLVGVEHGHNPSPVGLALTLWAAGELTVEVYWKLAHSSRTHAEVRADWANEPGVSNRQLWDRLRELRPLLEELQSDEPILPQCLDGWAARVTFFHTCESLLRAGETPALLSTPTYEDGSLDFDDLLARLMTLSGVEAGPLDVLQALYRLRPTDPSRADELNMRAIPTVAELTGRAGTFDAVALIRHWVAAGGLPQLEIAVDEQADRWRFSATAPVQWALCAATTDPVLDELSRQGGATARVLPLWPDLLVAEPFQDLEWEETGVVRALALLGGRPGLPVYDYLLGSVSRKPLSRRMESVEVLAALAANGVIDPRLAAAAARERCAAGTMSLARSAESWERSFALGGMRGMWPVVLEIASVCCELSPKPPGLPALLRMLSANVAEVPDPTVPHGIRSLAEQKGSSRSQIEARAYVAAATTMGAAS